MGTIEVFVPESTETGEQPDGELASRDALRSPYVLTIVDNGKPNARALLGSVADAIGKRVPLERVETVTKPTASAPIDADRARMQAARSHLVITGVGD